MVTPSSDSYQSNDLESQRCVVTSYQLLSSFPNIPYEMETTDRNEYRETRTIADISDRYINSKRIIVFLGLLVLVLIAMSQMLPPNSYNGVKLVTEYKNIEETKTANTFSIKIAIENLEYGYLSSASMHPWLIAEPFRQQFLTIANISIDDEKIDLKTLTSKYAVVWNINGSIYSGASASIFLTKVGRVEATVTLTSNDFIKKVYTTNFNIASKYVRREVKSLTERDRNKFFDAMKVMYIVSDEDGRSLYGSKYRSMEYFLEKHLRAAGTSDCDHWHDGPGILTTHAAITLEAEQSLQSIDPTLSMPYWEFSLDANVASWYDGSIVFGKDWFGEVNPSDSTHRIADGSRWDGLTFPSGGNYKDWDIQKTGSLNPYVNAFGMLRSQWNLNPSPYISRAVTVYDRIQYKSLPGCGQLQSCFQSDSLTTVHNCANSLTHGPVHIMIGGAWGDENVFSTNSSINDFDFLRSSVKALFFKNLWRLGYSRCPTSCSVSEPCSCSIPQEYIEEYGSYELLKKAKVISMLKDYLPSGLSEDDPYYDDLLKVVQSPGIVGDMFASSSSYDPTFWPLHGATERLVSYKRVLSSQGIVSFDSPWSYTDTTLSRAVELSGRSDWSNVKGVDDLTLPTYNESASCSGHAADDVIDFRNFLDQGETYTNAEFLEFMHPWNEDLPYVYDSYDYEYCTAQGYNFLKKGRSIVI